MVTNKPEDVGRRFVITFYMNDDTVMVYEPQVRNSGIVSGKFMEKMKYKNMLAGGRFFTPDDFMMGKTVQINAYTFVIQDQDERTKKWLEENYGTAYAQVQPNPYSMPEQRNGHSGNINESEAWQNFQNQQPVADGKGWEQDNQQGNFVDSYYGNAGQQGPTRR